MTEQTATAQDAQIILQLFDLRREAEMRKARRWVEMEFWPKTWDELLAIYSAYGSQENLYLRMVTGYWEMAASFVARGALNPLLFHDSNGEMYFLYAKLELFLFKMREHFQLPDAFKSVEHVVNTTPGGRERLRKTQTMIASFVEQREKRKEQSTAA